MKNVVALLLIGFACACSVDPRDPPRALCLVGRDCPDASVDAPPPASLPACADGPPALPACTCATYLCRAADAGVEQHDWCGPRGPQCSPDAGVEDAH